MMTNIERIRSMSVEELAKCLVRFSDGEIDEELVEEAIVFLNEEYEIKKVEIDISEENEELSSVTDNLSNLGD